jgi:hypothetical protein
MARSATGSPHGWPSATAISPTSSGGRLGYEDTSDVVHRVADGVEALWYFISV